MYFWKIEKLKDDLTAGRLSTAEQFKYLLATEISWSLVSVPFISDTNNWMDVANALIAVPLVGFGTYYLYVRNGGRDGINLFERYMSLAWVMTIRFLVLVVLPVFIIYFVVYATVAGTLGITTWPDVAIANSLLALFYFLLGRHIRAVARRAT